MLEAQNTFSRELFSADMGSLTCTHCITLCLFCHWTGGWERIQEGGGYPQDYTHWTYNTYINESGRMLFPEAKFQTAACRKLSSPKCHTAFWVPSRCFHNKVTYCLPKDTLNTAPCVFTTVPPCPPPAVSTANSLLCANGYLADDANEWRIIEGLRNRIQTRAKPFSPLFWVVSVSWPRCIVLPDVAKYRGPLCYRRIGTLKH